MVAGDQHRADSGVVADLHSVADFLAAGIVKTKQSDKRKILLDGFGGDFFRQSVKRLNGDGNDFKPFIEHFLCLSVYFFRVDFRTLRDKNLRSALGDGRRHAVHLIDHRHKSAIGVKRYLGNAWKPVKQVFDVSSVVNKSGINRLFRGVAADGRAVCVGFFKEPSVAAKRAAPHEIFQILRPEAFAHIDRGIARRPSPDDAGTVDGERTSLVGADNGCAADDLGFLEAAHEHVFVSEICNALG